MTHNTNNILFTSFIIILNVICGLACTGENEITKALQFLKEGKEKIKFSTEHKNITLVIGNTGAGKTTFLQWIAGDNDELTAQEQGENMGQFIIVDKKDRISISTINSKTTIPELVVDNNTNEAYYDCPGFSDTRSLTYNIAGISFTKRLTDVKEGFKIILIANHHSVRDGIDRHDFINLMRHTTEFIKNINRFRNSIAMVVTKVENTYIEIKKEKYVLVPDEEVIKNIANFLQKVKDHLKEKVEKLDIEEKFYENTIELLNILLEKDNVTYTRLGIFRRPNKEGPLNEVTVLREGKKHIQHIVRERLKYSLKRENDFGFTISEKSKNDISQLVEAILCELRNDIVDLTGVIHGYCESNINQIHLQINRYVNESEVDLIGGAEGGVSVLYQRLENIRDIYIYLNKSKGSEESGDISLQDLLSELNETVVHFGICADACKGRIENMISQERNYDYLKSLHNSKIDTAMWKSFLTPVTQCLSGANKVRIYIRDKVKALNKRITDYEERSRDDTELEDYYRKKIEKYEIANISFEVSKFITTTQNLLTYRKCAELQSIVEYDKEPEDWPPRWIGRYENTIKYLKESKIWYEFLVDILDEFSTYEKQMHIDKYNVAKIHDWGHEKRQQGIHIDKHNFKDFLKKIEKEDEFIAGIELTDERLGELNHILDLTLKHKPEIQCLESGKLIVRGSFLKMSDFTNDDGKIKMTCISITSVDIFASAMFIVDRNFNGVGSKIQLSIVAPIWYVPGSKTINLNGSKPSRPSKAKDGFTPSGPGMDGKPGLPGGPAGNFFGKANEIINRENLMITANGGQGGSGQDGGDGGAGGKGADAKRDEAFKKKYLRDTTLVTLFYNRNLEHYMYYGKSGTAGGPGGNGGVGGLGGFKGKIAMSIVSESLNSPIIENHPGKDGVGGKGGKGGVGGRKGHDLKAYYCKTFVLFLPIQLEWCEEEIIFSSEIAPSGESGQDGVNGYREEPEKPYPFQNGIEILNDYNQYLKLNMKDRFKKHSFLEFFHNIGR